VGGLEMIALLKELTLAEASSGGETAVREILSRELQPHVDSISFDPLGNLIAKKMGSSRSGPKLMITAHMDEIGARVSSIQNNGLVKFLKIGFVDDRIFPTRIVTIHTSSGDVDGVIGMPAPHLLTEAERQGTIPVTKLAIDIGAQSREDAEKYGIQIGDMISFKGQFFRLKNNIVLTKAVDDRVGVLVLIEVMKKLALEPHKATVFALGTVQEEVGMRGAITGTFQVMPDIAFPLDVTAQDPTDENIQLGKGPILRLFELGAYGSGIIVPQDLRDFVLRIAKDNNIPLQILARGGGRTEASEIHIIGKGVLSCSIEVPSRYIHTGSELVKLDDIEATVDLVTALIRNIEDFVGKKS
jgi:endoglucanase